MAAHDIKRVGMLFSGGPAPAANAVISAAALGFLNAGVEVVGFMDGYAHLERYAPECRLMEGLHFLRLGFNDVSGIRNRKSIILRTSRANPGKEVKSLADLADPSKNAKLLGAYGCLKAMGIDALVSIGGDDTLKTANYLHRLQEVNPDLPPLAVIHLPKTIDNDYYGIDWTFGFTTAADFAAREIRNLGADAMSTNAWYVLEIMGRKAGWLTYAAGIAGEATRMLSVEDVDRVFDPGRAADEVVDLILARAADGRHYGIVCVAEGLADRLPDELKPRQVDKHGNVTAGRGPGGQAPGRGDRAALRCPGGHGVQGPLQADRLRDPLRRADRLRHHAREPTRRRGLPGLARPEAVGAHGQRRTATRVDLRPLRRVDRPGHDEDQDQVHRAQQRLLPAGPIARVPDPGGMTGPKLTGGIP